MEFRFYATGAGRLESTLARMLERVIERRQRAWVYGSEARIVDLDAFLWRCSGFLAHGTQTDGDPDLQPIWLSHLPENANRAEHLFLLEGMSLLTEASWPAPPRALDAVRFCNILFGSACKDAHVAEIWRSIGPHRQTAKGWRWGSTGGWQEVDPASLVADS